MSGQRRTVTPDSFMATPTSGSYRVYSTRATTVPSEFEVAARFGDILMRVTGAASYVHGLHVKYVSYASADSDTHPLSITKMHALPIRRALLMGAERLRCAADPFEPWDDIETDEQVAMIYSWAFATGLDPMPEVMGQFGVNYSAAGRLIAAARKSGQLRPAPATLGNRRPAS